MLLRDSTFHRALAVLHDCRIAAAMASDYRLDIAKASESDRSCYMGSFFALQHNNRKIIAYDYRIQEESTQGKREKYLPFLLVSEDQFGHKNLGKQRQKISRFLGSKFPPGVRDLTLHFNHDDKSFYAFFVLGRGMS